MEKVSENIVKLRKKKKLTQDQLAEKLEVSRQAIHNWEKGTATPRGGNLKSLCEVLGVTSDQLLGKEPLDFEKKIESAIDGLKTNLKEEAIIANKKKRRAIIKKIRNITLILLVIITSIYVGCSLYKFGILTDIGEKVSKYKNLDNYYCEIQTYEGNYLQQKEEIWYKDNKYKIEKTLYDDIGQVMTTITNTINLENDTQITYIDKNYENTIEVQNKEKYENGNYMYNLFPDVVKNKFNNKMENSFGINLLKTTIIKEKNAYCLRINSISIELDRESDAPIFYTNGENNDNNRKYFKIELDSITDNDVTI